jgi:tRNA(Ile)-lysidine synthase
VPRLTGPDPATPDGFRRVVEGLAGNALAPGSRLGLAVSGGPDSLAMLWLGAQAFGDRSVVLTVDHGLRRESASECAAVCARASGLGLYGHLLRVTVPNSGAGLQADARAARYAALRDWCLANDVPVLLTAHHADDQAETVLMRLSRGSGLTGLAGIRAVRRLDGKLLLLRPLLGTRKAALAELLARAGWMPAEDPSNADPRHDRTRARALLAEAPWLRPHALAATAAELAQAEAALNWAEERAWASRVVSQPGTIRIDAEGLPAELQRRLVARALETLGAEPRGRAVARLAERLAGGGRGTLGGIAARALADGWEFVPAPPRRKS